MTRPISLRLRRTALSILLLSGATLAAAQTPPASSTSPNVAPSSTSSSTPSSAALPLLIATASPIAFGADDTAEIRDSASAMPASTQPDDSAPAGAPAALGAESASLPDAPDPAELHAALPGSTVLDAPGQAAPTVAPKFTKYIPSGWTAQPLTAHDKVLVGLRDLYSPLNFLAMVASAGYEQALNGEPNYGTDRGAFGQRLGAAAIRESSQGFLTDSVFSPLFHEDPRYYIQGVGHGFFYRAAYAATRPFITRTDNGNSTINAALLAGYAGSAALSYTYYPQINRNFHDTVSTFGGSLGGAALGYAVSEFSDDILKSIHLKKK